jgi:GNAT superfamily N-acetyltransferase
VAAFLPEFDGRDLNELVEDFQRVLVLGPSNRLDAVTQQTVGMGAEVSCIMPIVSVEESVYMPKAIARLDSMRAHLKGAYVPLLPDARRNQIRAVQQLQKDVGLTPLPGALLRGYHGSVATTILEDERGELLAAATCVGLSDVGADYADTAILLGVSVSPNAQGRGLGSGLTAVSLITARTMLGARRVIGVVHPDNAAAFRTNARFGMLPAGGLGAQYVELERTL